MASKVKLLFRSRKASEEASGLLKLPAELRHLIFQYILPDNVHIWAKNDHLHLSKCVVNCEDSIPCNAQVGLERAPDSLDDRDPVWIRRLQSAWGTHWECEERVLRKTTEVLAVDTLLRVCRRMHVDILDILARTAIFHITELETIAFASNALSRKPRAHSVPASFFERITKLNLTLRLPYAFCFGGGITTSICSYHDTYFRLDSFLAQLKRLKRFRLWLDHDSHHPWARVNETYLLEPFRQFLETENHDLLVILPKLNPHWEDPKRHFMEGNMAAFPLIRYVRQRFHAMPTCPKYWIVKFKPDFPFLLGVPQRTMEEIENAERELMKTHVTLQYVVEREYAHMIERRRKRREELSRR